MPWANFDFFYGSQAEQYQFYRIPKRLIVGIEFSKLSTDAKLLYGILLDRMSLSLKNRWLDDLGRVYIIYTVTDVQESLGCGNQKACRLLAELEQFGLILKKRQGRGRPNLLYVMDFASLNMLK